MSREAWIHALSEGHAAGFEGATPIANPHVFQSVEWYAWAAGRAEGAIEAAAVREGVLEPCVQRIAPMRSLHLTFPKGGGKL